MELNDLYQVVMILVVVGMLMGVGILVMSKFEASSGMLNTAGTALNNTISALNDISATWLSIIITVAAAAIILTLVVRSFVFNR